MYIVAEQWLQEKVKSFRRKKYNNATSNHPQRSFVCGCVRVHILFMVHIIYRLISYCMCMCLLSSSKTIQHSNGWLAFCPTTKDAMRSKALCAQLMFLCQRDRNAPHGRNHNNYYRSRALTCAIARFCAYGVEREMRETRLLDVWRCVKTLRTRNRTTHTHSFLNKHVVKCCKICCLCSKFIQSARARSE